MRVEIDLDEDECDEHSERKLLHRVLALLKHNEHKQNERHQQIMTALERLTASVTTGTNVSALTAAVDDAVSHIGNPGATDAQLNTLADSIDALNGTVAAQTLRLQTAVNPPPPTPGIGWIEFTKMRETLEQGWRENLVRCFTRRTGF